MWGACTHTMQYYSAIKKNEILPSAMTWMELECMMLSAISHRKTNTYNFTHMWKLRNKRNKPKNRFFFLKILFICERHTQREKDIARGRSRLPVGWCGTWSQDNGIMTWGEGRCSTTEPPRCPQTGSELWRTNWWLPEGRWVGDGWNRWQRLKSTLIIMSTE